MTEREKSKDRQREIVRERRSKRDREGVKESEREEKRDRKREIFQTCLVTVVLLKRKKKQVTITSHN